MLPPEIKLLKNLVYLNLANNYLLELPEEIYQLKQLRRLNLYKSQISEEQLNELRKRLPLLQVSFDPVFLTNLD